MKKLMISALALSLAAPVMAQANPGKGNGHAKGNGNQAVQQVRAPSNVANCPPGLAKKNPPCVPPGQAKKLNGYDDYSLRVGDVLDPDGFGDRYILVRDPGGYGLDPYGTYYRIGENVFRVDRETQEVLALVGAVTAVLN